MYESPIKITYSEPEAIELTSMAERISQRIVAQQEEYIYGAIAKMGVTVDKDELLKALQYDRDQYEKGYADGRAARDAEIVRCKDCKHYSNHDKRCTVWNHGIDSNGYCYKGEREDDDNH